MLEPETTEKPEESPLPERGRLLGLPAFGPTKNRGLRSLVEDQDTGETVLTTGPTVGPDSGRVSVIGSVTAPRTETSGRKDPAQARNTSKLVQGLVKLVVVIADAFITRAGREFRRPHDEQITSFSKPVARILIRHLDMTAVSDDLVDVTEAGGEVSGWLLEGPLAPRRYHDRPDNLIGMEHDEESPDPWNASTPAHPVVSVGTPVPDGVTYLS